MRKLIIFLLRVKHGLKEKEPFRFTNQKSEVDYYYFTEEELKKVEFKNKECKTIRANVSLNWMLDRECEIVKI